MIPLDLAFRANGTGALAQFEPSLLQGLLSHAHSFSPSLHELMSSVTHTTRTIERIVWNGKVASASNDGNNGKLNTVLDQITETGERATHQGRSPHLPSAQQENEFIRQHGCAAYAKWHQGIDDAEDEHSKGRYKFPYGDFEDVHRCGVLSAESRAGRYKHFDIEVAAGPSPWNDRRQSIVGAMLCELLHKRSATNLGQTRRVRSQTLQTKKNPSISAGVFLL